MAQIEKQEGWDELSQEDQNNIEGGQTIIGKTATMVDNVCESIWGGRPFEKWEIL